MKKSGCIIWIVFQLVLLVARGQDLHFSQFNMSPLNLNPAFTSYFDGNLRGVLNYRSQWSSVPVSYSTTSFSFDSKFYSPALFFKNNGAGILFNHDVSGDSRFGFTQLYLPLSTHCKLSKDSGLSVGVGVSPGISSVGFQSSKLTYDNQWDGDAFNVALPSGENFSNFRKTFFDLNIGGILRYAPINKISFIIGFGVSHLNQPQVSFFNNTSIKADQRNSIYFSAQYKINHKINCFAEYYIQHQGTFKENTIGSGIRYTINYLEKKALNSSVYLRTNDALILRAGYEIKQWQYAISYDINYSSFRSATKRRGAIEFSVIYIFKRVSDFTPIKRNCPVYL